MKEDLYRFGIGILVLICLIEPLNKPDLDLHLYGLWVFTFINAVHTAYIYGRDYFPKSPDEIIEENT